MSKKKQKNQKPKQRVTPLWSCGLRTAVVVMIISLPLGYTILVRSHAKCYSILTRASKRIELITRTNKKKRERQ